MLTQLEVFTSGVPTPPFRVNSQRPNADSIQITNIDGIGPVDADIQSTSYSDMPGSYVSNTNVPERNVILTVAFSPDWRNQTIELLRQILYQYFMPESYVDLQFSSTHLPTVKISGYVESMDVNIFSSDPSYKISIVCPKPYFVAIEPTTVEGVTQGYTGYTTQDIENAGSVYSGFTLDVVATSGAAELTNEIRVLNQANPYQLGIIRKVKLSGSTYFRWHTVDQELFARQMYSETDYSSLMGSVEKSGAWVKLLRGTNKIAILSTTPGYAWQLSYFARFGGL